MQARCPPASVQKNAAPTPAPHAKSPPDPAAPFSPVSPGTEPAFGLVAEYRNFLDWIPELSPSPGASAPLHDFCPLRERRFQITGVAAIR